MAVVTEANTEHPNNEHANNDDPFRWLEDVTGEDALDWVRARNADALGPLTSPPRFERLRDELRAILDSDDRIPYARRRGDYLYNFWRDEAHPKGLWRRTTLEEYRREQPDWQILLDLDALAERERENWVWKGASVLRPGNRRALVELSRGGADATVVREFDLDDADFVTDGFYLPEAKSTTGWIDIDRIYVGTDFGPGSLTTSGYPRIAKEWRRGTPLADAELVYEGKLDDIAVVAGHDPTEGHERDLVHRSIDFYRRESFLRRETGDLLRIDTPDDAEIDVHRQWLLVQPRSPWTPAGVTYPAGSLIATGFADFMDGGREFTVLFEPDRHTALDYHVWTRHHLILSTLSDVQSRMWVLTPGPDTWAREALPGVPEHSTADVMSVDAHTSDEYMLDVSGFSTPAQLRRGVVGEDTETLKRAPSFFDTAGISVRQFFATSPDATLVPYFVVGADATTGPTLLTGYGGFEVSRTPGYSGLIGKGWLERGGTYVVANIRGGGEYGPEWHTGAVKANRHLVHEDFAAVAEDLVRRGVSTPERLGIQGGSNGGLLMGVMLTRYPELFGAIVCQVPLLDMRRYHRLLAGASWMAEYGDPDDESQWSYIKEYSPYQNVRSGQPYPPTLFVTSTRDDRVHPGHARKMVARLLEDGYSPQYYENIEGGHGGAADNEQLAFMWSLVFEFLWQRLAGGGQDQDGS
jgi:prolyl oligopeptidase